MKPHRLFPILLVLLLALSLAPRAGATMVVFDPTNWVENFLKEIEEVDQTSIQKAISSTASTISSVNQTINQYTQYIYNLKNLIQQAVGTVTQQEQLVSQLYGQITSIPYSFETAFNSILNIPNQFQSIINGNGSWTIPAALGGSNWAASNDPLIRYLGGAISQLQQLTGLANQAGYSLSQPASFTAYHSAAFASNLNQALAAQALKQQQQGAQQTLSTLTNQAKAATTQQAGQGVQNQTAIQSVAAQNQANNLAAAQHIATGQTNANEIQRYNTNITGAQTGGGSAFYNTFNP